MPTRPRASFDGATGEAAGTVAAVTLTGSIDSLAVGPGHVFTVDDPAGGVATLRPGHGRFTRRRAVRRGGVLALLPRQDGAIRSVTVTAVAPTVIASTVVSPSATTVSLSASVADAGPNDSRTYWWSVTGGTASGSTTSPTFTFTPTGQSAVVSLTVTDDGGKGNIYGEGDRDRFLVNPDGTPRTRDEVDEGDAEVWIDLDP